MAPPEKCRGTPSKSLHESSGGNMNYRISAFFTLITLGLFALSACASYTPEAMEKDGWKQMSRSELQSLGPHTLTGKASSGRMFVAFMDGNGNIRISVNKGKFKDSGTYVYTVGNRICTQYNKIRKGVPDCEARWKKGETYRTIRGKSLSSEYAITSGNPENL